MLVASHWSTKKEVTTLMDATLMPRRKNQSKRNDRAVKIDAEVVGQAKHVCEHRGISLAEYLSSILKLPVAADFEKFKREINKTK